jgi:hypothetical protein
MTTKKVAKAPPARSARQDSIWDWLQLVEPASGGQSHRNQAARPSTPEQDATAIEKPNAFSPTDTTFSDNSVFDMPEHGTDTSNEAGLRARRGQYATSSSSATTVTSEGAPSSKEFCDEDFGDSRSIAQAGYDFDAPSLSSYDPPTGLPSSTAQSQCSLQCRASGLESAGPNLVFIKSCLQCTLANLPCSRTYPACSRCIRGGHGDLCLLRRAKRVEELGEFNECEVQEPVLLKIKGVDEVIWARKFELYRQVSIPSYSFQEV